MGRRTLLHQMALLQHRHPVGHLGHHAEVVRDEQHARALLTLQLADEFQDLRLGGDIQRRGGLVGDEQCRLEDQRHGDHHALALATGELVRVGGYEPLRVGQVHARHHVQHLDAALGRVPVRVLAQHFVDLPAAGVHGVQRRHRLLEDHGHACRAGLPQPLRAGAQHILALQQDATRCGAQPRGQQPHHGLGHHRLARAGLTHQAHELATAHPKVDVLHGAGPVSPCGQRDGQALDVQHR